MSFQEPLPVEPVIADPVGPASQTCRRSDDLVRSEQTRWNVRPVIACMVMLITFGHTAYSTTPARVSIASSDARQDESTGPTDPNGPVHNS
jgi:hypothetical protein